MTEARPMVCYSRGVMDSLVDKLTDMKDTHPMVDPLLQDLESLREDLVDKFNGSRAMHKQVKVWMKQIRELVYYIEDWIDLKLAGKLDESETDFDEQIVEFKAKIEAARARSERCNLLSKAPTSETSKKVAVDSQLLLEQQVILFGISDPRKELEKHLKDTQKNRKVVSVLGMGGLGKTTLATKVYEELNGRFECHASVTVGRNSSITALKDVFRQVNPEMLGHDTRASLNEQVIPRLWEFLKNKRYFIFIDDIRNTHEWSVINCALPNNVLESRILTTTRVKDVAKSCSVRPTDVVYEMKGLDKDNSKSLLLTTISVKAEDRSANFEKYCDDMLKKCCGFPLAITVTAGLLATNLADLGPLGKPEESDEMRNVLDICFADLDPPVKACFLYLSTFPENYSIRKGRLIQRWVAEGFIPGIDQESMLETGERYFNELICRKLIRPVFEDYSDDQAVVCTVHPVIHDFIASLSRQEDFHTTAAELISGPFPYGTIRRFSVNCSRQGNNEADTLISTDVHLSRMRSLTVFGDAGRVPDLWTFKHLRVLDLEDMELLHKDLRSIGNLTLLRYLGLAGAALRSVPQEIIALEHLETVDLRRTWLDELPAFKSRKLVSLIADRITLQEGIWGMQVLEELATVLVRDDGDRLANLVNQSKRLRRLDVIFGHQEVSAYGRNGLMDLLGEIGNSDIRSLRLVAVHGSVLHLVMDYWAKQRPCHLQKLELRIDGILPEVPRNMLASLIDLTHLSISVGRVDTEGLCILGNLPNLVFLSLVPKDMTERSIISKNGFRCLRVFCYDCLWCGMGLQFEAGAMPQLRRLRLQFDVKETESMFGGFDFGIQFLTCLVQVHATIYCNRSTAASVEAAIRDQVSRIPYSPLPVHDDDLRKEEATIEADSSSSTPSVDIKISILPESSSHLPIPGFISFVMEDAMVGSSTGAMNSVLTKLVTLTGDRYAELTGADKQELMMLRHELQVMSALLKQLSDTADLDIQIKGCRNQMRELTYGIEDSIDDLLSDNEEGSGSTGKRVMPHDFIEQIQKLNAQVEKAELGSRTEKRTFGPRLMPREQWLSQFYYDERVKPCVERDEPSVETMRQTFSYLSSDMKTCLLYLSSFPANHVVRKDRLIRRWKAEGFLPKRSVESFLETGESYFLELIDMKLIEPVYDDEEDVLLPTCCKVGGSVHGFITALSSEENFVKLGKDGVFWRISGDIKRQLAALFKELSKVRSLTIHMEFGYRWTHDLSAFKHLRVLDLEDTSIGLDEEALRVVGHLSLVRYLGLAGAALRSVPQEIIALEHLETVDLGRTTLRWHPIELPVFKSRKLVSLIADRITLQEGMGEMQVLEELATVLVRDDGDRLANLVNQSKRLRRLDLIFDRQEVSAYGINGLMSLLGEIGNSDIRSLRVVVVDQSDFHFLLDYWAQQRPHHFQKLELTTYDVLREVPRNMSPSLIDLTHLSISVGRVDTEGLCILGNLPNLVFLSLRHRDTTERVIISDNSFRCLKVFWYDWDDSSWYNVGMGLQFKAGAMPQLRRLRLRFRVRETESKFGGFDFGIQFLTCLVQLHATIDCYGSTAASVDAVEAAIRHQVSENPNNPVLEIITRE